MSASNRGIVREALDKGGFLMVLGGAVIATVSSFWLGVLVSFLGLVLMALGVYRIVRESE